MTPDEVRDSCSTILPIADGEVMREEKEIGWITTGYRKDGPRA